VRNLKNKNTRFVIIIWWNLNCCKSRICSIRYGNCNSWNESFFWI